jgi:hypothetical protein
VIAATRALGRQTTHWTRLNYQKSSRDVEYNVEVDNVIYIYITQQSPREERKTNKNNTKQTHMQERPHTHTHTHTHIWCRHTLTH